MKPQGAGSIWNPNSWHWEEKDHTKTAQKLIGEKINSIKVESSGITVTVEAQQIKGDAQVNIRKGKQILNFDFDIDVNWKGDSDADEAEGSFKVKDFTCLDSDFDFIHLTAKTKTPISEKCKDIIKSQVYKQIKEKLQNFAQDLAQYESDPQKLQEDQKKRAEAEQLAKQAYEQNGLEKERIFQEQKEKEKQMKEQYSQWGPEKQGNSSQQQQ